MPANQARLRWSPPLPGTLGQWPVPEVVPVAVWDERLVPWPRRRPHRTWRRWLRRRHAAPGSKRPSRVPVGPVVLPPAVPKRPSPGAVWRAGGIAPARFPLAVGVSKRHTGEPPLPSSTEASSERTKGTDPPPDPLVRNVQTATIRPIVHQMVVRGARVYTDSYGIYNFLTGDGYPHLAVNHSAGQYALDLDGDGKCEVHCNTMENTWSWLRQAVRTYRGVSKVYLPLYVAQFEFFFNRRHQDRWNCTLDVLVAAFQVEASSAADLLACVQTAQFSEVCPVAG